MAIASARGKLIGVIGDEDTCVGFLLGGIGEMNKNRQPNFLVVDKNTAITDIEDSLKKFIRRDDIDIILINQNVAELVRSVIDAHTAPIPAILEIPSKDYPYDPSKDSILRRAKGLFNPEREALPLMEDFSQCLSARIRISLPHWSVFLYSK